MLLRESLTRNGTASEHAPARQPEPTAGPGGRDLSRRGFLAAAGVVSAGAMGYSLSQATTQRSQAVFLAKNQRYDGPLARTIRDGLSAVGFNWEWVRGRQVLLKPNIVEPSPRTPHITTHPAVLLAAAEVFRSAGALVSFGEGPAHLRDSEWMLVESGLEEATRGERLPFADINYSETRAVANRGRLSQLKEIVFPREVIEADLIVSMAKLKTHHWAGMTAAMKNLYGLLPGSVYGWPKNVLHHAGIPQTVVDIAATAPRSIAVIDAILCAEGDGPILGTPKPLGVLAVGQNLAAVDATLARVMGLEPSKVPYLKMADGLLGPIAEPQIIQRGELWTDVRSPFNLLDVDYLQAMRA